MSKISERVQFIRESIDNHISEMQENDLIAEQVLVLCEQEGIDPESLTEEELHEIFNTLKKIGAGIKGAVGGAGARFMAGFNTPTTSDRAKSQLDKVRADRFKRAKDAAIDYAGKKLQPVRGGNKPKSKPAGVKTPGSKGRPAHGGRTAVAESFNNFIDRTVGILMSKLEEIKAERVHAAAVKKARGTGGSVEGNSPLGHSATVNKAGKPTAKVVKFAKDDPYKPTTASGARAGGMITRVGRKGTIRSRFLPENFISNTVEILMERIKANKKAKNAWMANQPTDPDNEPKIPKRDRSGAKEDVEGAVQFNAVRRSQYNVPKDSRVPSGAGDSGKPFDAKSRLTAARTVKKHTTSPFMSAVNAKHARSNKAYKAKRDNK